MLRTYLYRSKRSCSGSSSDTFDACLIHSLMFLMLLLFNLELLFVVVTSEQISRSSALLTGFDRKWFIPDCMAFYLKDASV